ncbi:CG31089 [Drosophila busckii]|uniref:Lipase n=1 Tax=Drosophila busckii TaxID=30019 RepID=A0A0M4F5F0_DROBS|nr:lipase 3 [Drosophila busckii]ALC46757.1 CG31089 [Drosophila busckii]
MQYKLILALIFLFGYVWSVQTAAVDVAPVDIDFYKLYNDPDAHLAFRERRTTRDRMAAHGYPAEHHHVVTEDGYILGIFRIPYSHKLKNQDKKRPVVLIQHGLFSCSDAWILSGPNDALPYLLADAGFDVWIGNARGTTYSRNHTTLSTQHPYFWRFDWHEIGVYDMSAMIDYALKTNGQGQKSLHYVGHSQGTTVYFALMSTVPEYNKKIKTANLFAPIAIMKNMRNKLVRKAAPYLGHHNTYSLLFSSQEFIPHNSFISIMFFNLCEPDLNFRIVCNNVVGRLYDANRVNMTAMPEGMATHPAGCSTNQILHYLQEQQSGHFRQYDHGPAKNLLVYKSEQPPDYPVEKITSELHMWYSDNDIMAAVEDVLALAKRLPNHKLYHMEDPDWDHGDFALNKDVRKYLNEPVIEIMLKYEEAHN